MESPAYVGFIDAVKLFFKNYVNFKGRSTRSEFWFWTLANFIVNAAVTAVAAKILSSTPSVPLLVWQIATLVPGLALFVRRLHDIGKEWFWILLPLICFVPIILGLFFDISIQFGGTLFLIGLSALLGFTIAKSGPDNKWGAKPSKKE